MGINDSNTFLVACCVKLINIYKVLVSAFSGRQCVRAQSLSRVWLFVTLWTVVLQAPLHGISRARILEWVATSSSRRSSPPRDEARTPMAPALAGGFFTTEPAGKCLQILAVCVILQMRKVRLRELSEWSFSK